MKGLKKLGGLFLVAVFLFVGIMNVKAYSTTTYEIGTNLNLDGYITFNFLGVDKNDKGKYITLKEKAKDDNAKVYLQFVEISTSDEFESMVNKADAYKAAVDKYTADESQANEDAMWAAYNALAASVPDPVDANWKQLTLKDSTATANRYNAEVDTSKHYFVAWVKVETSSKTYYGYDINCIEQEVKICWPDTDNNKYYNSKGEEVTKEAYAKDCLSCKPLSGDEYVNKAGEIVTKDAYLKDCFSCQTPSESSDGKYHDKDGKETDEAGYKKACNPNCKIENGKYFDNDGNEITKTQYDKLCGNPKTGNQTFYLYGIATVAIAFTLYMFTRKIRKFSK